MTPCPGASDPKSTFQELVPPTASGQAFKFIRGPGAPRVPRAAARCALLLLLLLLLLLALLLALLLPALLLLAARCCALRAPARLPACPPTRLPAYPPAAYPLPTPDAGPPLQPLQSETEGRSCVAPSASVAVYRLLWRQAATGEEAAEA